MIPLVQTPRQSSSSRGRALLFGAIAMLAASCGTEPCVAGVDQAGRYKIDVVERYDEQSRFTYHPMIGLRPGWTQGLCMAADGIGAGASVVLAGPSRQLRDNPWRAVLTTA